MALEVREARRRDKEGVFDFLPRIWKDDYIQGCWDGWLKERDGRVFVALSGSTPVGMIHVFIEGGCGWVEAIRVDPPHQRHGIGKALAGEAVAFAASKGAKVVRLSTSSANLSAQGQVEKMGFRGLVRLVRFRTESLRMEESAARIGARKDKGRVLDFIESSRALKASAGLYASDWRWKPLDERALDVFLDKKQVLVAGEGDIEGLLLFADFELWEDRTTEICFLDGNEKAIISLLGSIRTVSRERGNRKVYGFAPRLTYLTDSIRKSGFLFEDRDMIIYEKKL